MSKKPLVRAGLTDAGISGLYNVFNNTGIIGRDPMASYVYGASPVFDEGMCTNIYMGNGIARKVIDQRATEMTRKGVIVSLEDDPDRRKSIAIEEWMQSYGIWNSFADLIRWSQLYGGALMVFVVKDGLTMTAPLNPSRIKGLIGVHVYDRWRVTYTAVDYDDDIYSPTYGMPKQYLITPLSPEGYALQPYYVSASRCIRMDWLPTPPQVMALNGGWGASVLSQFYTQLMHLAVSFSSTSHMMIDYVQPVLRMENLMQLLCAPDGVAKVRARLQALDMGRSTMNTVLLDADEVFERLVTNPANLGEVLTQMCVQLSAVVDWPYSRLFGQPPKGMNATGEYEDKNYREKIIGEQMTRLQPVVERFFAMFAKYFGEESIPFRFAPISDADALDLAKARRDDAEAIQRVVQSGVVGPESFKTVVKESFNLSDAEITEPNPALLGGNDVSKEAPAPVPTGSGLP